MKFSFEYVKKNPLLFTMIALVFGVFVLLMLNKGADSGSGGAVGPSDAQIAAQAQLAAKQLDIAGSIQMGGLQIQALAQQGANDVALAQIASQVALAQLAQQAHSDELGIAASLSALQAQLAANVEMNNSNNQFQIDYAKIAADNALAIVEVNAQAFTTASILNQIGTLKKGKRDNALAAFFATYYGNSSNAADINAIMQPNGAKSLPNYSGGDSGGFFDNITGGIGGGVIGSIL